LQALNPLAGLGSVVADEPQMLHDADGMLNASRVFANNLANQE
jgi:hypothetical protein